MQGGLAYKYSLTSVMLTDTTAEEMEKKCYVKVLNREIPLPPLMKCFIWLIDQMFWIAILDETFIDILVF